MLILDRDGLINISSKDGFSPYYYILRPEFLVLRPGVREAFALLCAQPVVLATRQKCISKGLISATGVTAINRCLEDMLGFQFHSIYVESEGEDKTNIFTHIRTDFPQEKLYLIDDSVQECNAAVRLGYTVYHSDDLYTTLIRHNLWLPNPED